MDLSRNFILLLMALLLPMQANSVTRTFNSSGSPVYVQTVIAAKAIATAGTSSTSGGFGVGLNASSANDLFVSDNALTDVVFTPSDQPSTVPDVPAVRVYAYGPTVMDDSSGYMETTDAGKLQISAGTVTVGPGITLNMPGGIEVTGTGVLNVAGAKLGEALITNIAYTSSKIVDITLDRDVSKIINTDHFLVVMDEDPYGTSETLTGKSIQVDNGRNEVGAHRPSFAKWIWIDVTAVSGAVVTGEFDQWEGTANLGGTMEYDGKVKNGNNKGGSPYRGTRGNVVSQIQTIELNEPWWFGTSTRFQLKHGVAGLVSGNHRPRIDSDFGSQYLEIVASATDSTCVGKMAKVLNTSEYDDTSAATEATSGDIFVAGDLSHCGTSGTTVRITNGLRVGDRVALVNPAILDFSNASGTSVTVPSDLTGYLYWGGGTINMEWARIVRLGSMAKENIDADISLISRRMNCSVCIFRKDAGSVHTGYIKNTNIAYAASYISSETASSAKSYDTVTLYVGENSVGFTSSSGEYGNKRFATPLDMSGVVFDRIHVSDAIHNERYDALDYVGISSVADLECGIESGVDDVPAGSTAGNTAGTHVWFAEANNLTVSRLRSSRMSDDGFGARAATGGHPDWDQRMNFSHIIVEEAIACTRNSQEGFSLNMNPVRMGPDVDGSEPSSGGLTISDTEALNRQRNVSDILAMGSYSRSYDVNGNWNVNGVVTTAGFAGGIRGGDQDGNLWNMPVDFGTVCAGQYDPYHCCTSSTENTCEALYPTSDAFAYPPTLSNAFVFMPIGDSFFKSSGTVSDSLIQGTNLYPTVPDNYRQNIGQRISHATGSLIQSNYGNYSNSGRTCTGVAAGWTHGVGAWQRPTEISNEDVLLVTPVASKYGNSLTGDGSASGAASEAECGGAGKLTINRSYILAGGGDGATGSAVDTQLGRGGYLQSTGSNDTLIENFTSIIKNSSLATSLHISSVDNNHRGWGACDLVVSSTECRLGHPMSSSSVRENLCARQHSNDIRKNSQEHYGQAYNDNNHVLPYFGPMLAHSPSDPTSSTTLISYPVDRNYQHRIQDFTQPMGGGVCGESRPKRIGFSDWMVTHALMGDFANEQWRNFSTDNLGIEIVNGI